VTGRRSRVTPDTVALALAVGLVLVLVVLSVIALVEISGPSRQPGENLTQILATILGGIVGALGAYLGRSARRRPAPGPELVELAPAELAPRSIAHYPRRPVDQDATEELTRDEAPPNLTSLGGAP
jgi:hypothetical protein